MEQVEGDGTAYYDQADQLGSIRALTDSTGAVVNSYTYDAYGNRTSSSETVANPFGYAGGYRDSESGLYYLQARYYDPSTQQFLTVDPLVAATGQAYNYVGGSPVNGTDPGGLDPGGPSGYSDPPVPGFLCFSFGWFCSPGEQAAADFYAWRRQAAVNLIWVNQRYHIVQGTDSLVTGGQVAQLGSTACSLSPGPELPAGAGGAIPVLGAGGYGLADGVKLTVNQALDAAQAFLGSGYSDMGNGRFQSADGLRQVRMSNADILGQHWRAPHINFETWRPDPVRPGRMIRVSNIHAELLP